MAPDLALLLLTAASIGVVHTLLGPDHYLPFVALSKARAWTDARTAAITASCGVGHVLGSILIGAIGIAAGTAVERLVHVEAWRGDIAAWLLFGFGLAYLVWGVKRALRGETHSHLHVHADGTRHSHDHDHRLAPHVHPHVATLPVADAVTFAPVAKEAGRAAALATPWTLFIIFVFGPCEPLIPLVMYPAARHDMAGVALVAAAFGLTTILTMLAIIALSSWGLSFVRLGRLERYAHAIAGAMIFVSGLAVRLLGL